MPRSRPADDREKTLEDILTKRKKRRLNHVELQMHNPLRASGGCMISFDDLPQLSDITNDFTQGLWHEKHGRTDIDAPEHWSKAFNSVRDDANPLLLELFDEFQKRLGITDP